MLGEQIKKLRLARNMSQVELAHRLGVSKQSVSNWENNNILPSIDILRKIALFFSCSTDYLLELNTGDRSLDITALTLEQANHIQNLVHEFDRLNKYERLYKTPN